MNHPKLKFSMTLIFIWRDKKLISHSFDGDRLRMQSNQCWSESILPVLSIMSFRNFCWTCPLMPMLSPDIFERIQTEMEKLSASDVSHDRPQITLEPEDKFTCRAFNPNSYDSRRHCRGHIVTQLSLAGDDNISILKKQSNPGSRNLGWFRIFSIKIYVFKDWEHDYFEAGRNAER